MSKKHSVDPNFDANAYSKELVQSLVSEVYKLLLADKQVLGEEFCLNTTKNFIASFIATLVYSGLKSAAESTAEPVAQYETTLRAFRETRTNIEEAVAEGFSGGFQAFNPNTVPDYDCKITCLDPGDITGPTQ